LAAGNGLLSAVGDIANNGCHGLAQRRLPLPMLRAINFHYALPLSRASCRRCAKPTLLAVSPTPQQPDYVALRPLLRSYSKLTPFTKTKIFLYDVVLIWK